MKIEGWRMKDEGWRMRDEGWRMKDEGWRMMVAGFHFRTSDLGFRLRAWQLYKFVNPLDCFHLLIRILCLAFPLVFKMDSYDSDSEPEAAFVFRRNSTVSLNSEPCSKIESNNLKSFLSVPGNLNNEIKLPLGFQ